MKLKELKCKNCGAKLEVLEDAKKVDCKFCNSSFFIENSYDEAYKHEKGRLEAQTDHYKENVKEISKVGKIIFIVFVIIFALITIFIGTIVYKIVSTIPNKTNDINEVKDKFDSEYFNSTISYLSGTKNGFILRSYLELIVTSNKENKKHQITVEYKEIRSNKEEDIVNIKKLLDDSTEYEVTVNYDEKGFINEVIIK